MAIEDIGFKAHPENINKAGRPKKGYSITELFREMMDNAPETKKALANSILKKALGGDIAAQKLIWNYMDGLPHQSVDMTTQGEKITGLDIKIVDGKITDTSDERIEEESGEPKENNG